MADQDDKKQVRPRRRRTGAKKPENYAEQVWGKINSEEGRGDALPKEPVEQEAPGIFVEPEAPVISVEQEAAVVVSPVFEQPRDQFEDENNIKVGPAAEAAPISPFEAEEPVVEEPVVEQTVVLERVTEEPVVVGEVKKRKRRRTRKKKVVGPAAEAASIDSFGEGQVVAQREVVVDDFKEEVSVVPEEPVMDAPVVEVPVVPMNPFVSDEPMAPEEPAMEVPVAPEEPAMEVPVAPEEPAMEVPVTPVNPFASDAPVAPVGPFASDAPVVLDQPAAPVSPFASDVPVAPVSPFASDAPVAPVSPFASDAPVAPVNPFAMDQSAAPYVPPVNPFAMDQPAAPYAPPVNPFAMDQPAAPYAPPVNPFSFADAQASSVNSPSDIPIFGPDFDSDSEVVDDEQVEAAVSSEPENESPVEAVEAVAPVEHVEAEVVDVHSEEAPVLVVEHNDVDDTRDEFWHILEQAGITKGVVKGVVAFIIVLILGLFVYFFWFSGAPKSVPREVTKVVENTDVDSTDSTISQIVSSYIFGLEYTDEANPEIVAEPIGKYGVTTGLDLAFDLGFQSDFRKQVFVDDVELLRRIKNLTEIDVYALVDSSVDRRKIVGDLILEMQTIVDDSDKVVVVLNNDLALLNAKYKNSAIVRDDFEQKFFDSMNALKGQQAFEFLSSFIDNSDDGTRLKAYYEAEKLLLKAFQRYLIVLKPRLEDVKLNQEALIKGVKVIDVPGSNIDSIIKVP